MSDKITMLIVGVLIGGMLVTHIYAEKYREVYENHHLVVWDGLWSLTSIVVSLQDKCKGDK